MAEIGRVVLADIRRDAKIGTEEGGTQFPNQLLAGKAFVAKMSGKVVHRVLTILVTVLVTVPSPPQSLLITHWNTKIIRVYAREASFVTSCLT